MTMPAQTLQGHPGVFFYADEFTPILKVDFFTSSCHRLWGMLAIMLYRRDCYTGDYSVNRGHDAV
jgi:hypothetical protein